MCASLMVFCFIFSLFLFFFFNDTATTEIYTLSLHDALPISDPHHRGLRASIGIHRGQDRVIPPVEQAKGRRSEEHTSELQSRRDLVCRLLLEKKKKKMYQALYPIQKNKYFLE